MAVVVLLSLLGLVVLFHRPLLALLMTLAMAIGSSKSVPPASVSESVGVSLMRWGVFGPQPDGTVEHTNLIKSITSKIRTLVSILFPHVDRECSTGSGACGREVLEPSPPRCAPVESAAQA
jgi:hypothetical protein